MKDSIRLKQFLLNEIEEHINSGYCTTDEEAEKIMDEGMDIGKALDAYYDLGRYEALKRVLYTLDEILGDNKDA